jgi:hypothetical protein
VEKLLPLSNHFEASNNMADFVGIVLMKSFVVTASSKTITIIY